MAVPNMIYRAGNDGSMNANRSSFNS